MAKIHSIPAFSKHGEDAQGGCAFIVRDFAGGLWVVTVAHMMIWGKQFQGDVTADFSRWQSRMFLSPRYGKIINVDIFEDEAKTKPKFKWCGAAAEIGDIIAISIPESGLAQLDNVNVIDATAAISQHSSALGVTVQLEGFPQGFLKSLDYADVPKRSGGRMITDSLATYDGSPEDAPGFSGSPVLSARGQLMGMFIGHGMGRMVLLPAPVILFLVHSQGVHSEFCPVYNVSRFNRSPNGVLDAA